MRAACRGWTCFCLQITGPARFVRREPHSSTSLSSILMLRSHKWIGGVRNDRTVAHDLVELVSHALPAIDADTFVAAIANSKRRRWRVLVACFLVRELCHQTSRTCHPYDAHRLALLSTSARTRMTTWASGGGCPTKRTNPCERVGAVRYRTYNGQQMANLTGPPLFQVRRSIYYTRIR